MVFDDVLVVMFLISQRLSAVLDELESLKPEVQQRVEELNKAHTGVRLVELDGHETTSYGSGKMSPLEYLPVNKWSNMNVDIKQVLSHL